MLHLVAERINITPDAHIVWERNAHPIAMRSLLIKEDDVIDFASMEGDVERKVSLMFSVSCWFI